MGREREGRIKDSQGTEILPTQPRLANFVRGKYNKRRRVHAQTLLMLLCRAYLAWPNEFLPNLPGFQQSPIILCCVTSYTDPNCDGCGKRALNAKEVGYHDACKPALLLTVEYIPEAPNLMTIITKDTR